MFAIFGGPRPAFCVEVKPRKSSEPSGIRNEPGTCAATAIFFGSPCPPWKPPPAKPLRMLVTSKMPRSWKIDFEPSAMWSSRSLRSSTATSFASRIVSGGSLGKRIESSSTRTSLSLVFEARRSTGMCSPASLGT